MAVSAAHHLYRHRFAAAAVVLPLVVPSAANAFERQADGWVHEVSIGVLQHDTDFLWARTNRESGVDVNGEVLFRSIGSVLGATFHPALGVAVNTRGDTSKAYVGIRMRYEFDSGIFLGLGLGAAVHNGELRAVRDDRKALGARFLFHIPAEIGYRFSARYAASIYFDHVSNANLADRNEGLDTLGLRLAYRF